MVSNLNKIYWAFAKEEVKVNQRIKYISFNKWSMHNVEILVKEKKEGKQNTFALISKFLNK